MSTLFRLLCLIAIFYVKYTTALDSLTVYTNGTTLIIDDEYISATLDCSLWRLPTNGFDLLESSDLQLYASNYKPSTLRFGGTSCDALCYQFNDKNTENIKDKPINNCNNYMNKTEFITLNNWVNDIGFELVFGLNSLIRTKNGAWNSSNAQQLFDYIYNKNGNNDITNIHFELGNEPDIYEKKYNYAPPNGTQLYNDFMTLSNVLSTYDKRNQSKIYGIDVTTGTDGDNGFYLYEEFVSNFNSNKPIPKFEAFTFHHYYGVNLSYNDFINVTLMDTMIDIAQKFYNTKMRYNVTKNIPLWIGESGTDASPNPKYTNNSFYDETYMGNFLWLDEIGVASSIGINKIVRHAIWDHILGLTSDNNYNNTDLTNINDVVIHPDYYATILFKQLLGYGVLKVENNLQKGRTLRVYGFCSKKNYVLLMIINVRNEIANLNITFHDYKQVSNREEYHLTYDGELLNSNYIKINNQTMSDKYTSTPVFTPLIVSNKEFIQIQPYSFAYVVYDGLTITACKKAAEIKKTE
eukprot:345733_1